MTNYLHKLITRLGYSKTEYLHQARAKTREAKEKSQEKHQIIVTKDAKIKDLNNKLSVAMNSQPQPFVKTKLKYWADKVKRSKCCDICEATEVPLSAHHLWAKSQHPTLAYEHANGVALCLTCHDGYHKKYNHIEDCNPFTYKEYKTDEKNKIRLAEVEKEVKELKERSLSKTTKLKLLKFLGKM